MNRTTTDRRTVDLLIILGWYGSTRGGVYHSLVLRAEEGGVRPMPYSQSPIIIELFFVVPTLEEDPTTLFYWGGRASDRHWQIDAFVGR